MVLRIRVQFRSENAVESSSRKTRGGASRSGRAGRAPTKPANGHISAIPMAARADRHVLYQESVQAVDAEIDFISDTYNSLRGRSPSVIREDFCGTANSACEFVRRRATNRAIGVDLDQPTLDWGRAHNLAKLRPEARRRVTLLRDNVLSVRCEPVDAVLAMNFSYYCFTDRATMRRYFEHVRESLAPGGLFFLDAYGGYDAFRVLKEPRKLPGGVTYIWDQADYDPISGVAECHIDFKFRDGSHMKKAFSYRWRVWTLPEIREILNDAGFSSTKVYWEGWDESGTEGNGEFKPVKRGDPDPGWVVYIVAEK